jgi:hypothetical protein
MANVLRYANEPTTLQKYLRKVRDHYHKPEVMLMFAGNQK